MVPKAFCFPAAISPGDGACRTTSGEGEVAGRVKASDHRCTGGRSRRGFGFTGRSRTKESKAHVVTRPRLQRRACAGGAKTDKILVGCKTLVQKALSAYKRGDKLGYVQWSRRHSRERKIAATFAAEPQSANRAERLRHVNVYKGLLLSQAYPDISPAPRPASSGGRYSKPATARAPFSLTS